MANKLSFGRLLRNPKRQSTVGFKKLVDDSGKVSVDIVGKNKKELKQTLDILNAEANNRLLVAQRRINKALENGKTINQILGNVVGEIYEFNPATGGRFQTLKSGEYGVKQFKSWRNMSEEDLIRQIRDRERFLNKESSTVKGLTNIKNKQKQAFNDFIQGSLENALGRNVTKNEVNKISTLLQRLKDNKLLFRQKGTSGNIIGTDNIIQMAVDLISQEKGIKSEVTVDDIANTIKKRYNELDIMAKKAKAEAKKNRKLFKKETIDKLYKAKYTNEIREEYEKDFKLTFPHTKMTDKALDDFIVTKIIEDLNK